MYNFTRRNLAILACLISSLILSACGGGGDDTTPKDNTVIEPNTVPVIAVPTVLTITSDTDILANDTRIQSFLSAASASDAEDGDISASITHDITAGYTFSIDATKTVKFTIIDSDGNEVSKTSTVSIQLPEPDTAPELTVPTALTITSDTAILASESRIQSFLSAATASDAEDGDISASITHDITADYTFSIDATKTVKFTVIDSDGNEVSKTATVSIQLPEPDTAPVITVPTPLTILSNIDIPKRNTSIQRFLSAATASDAEDSNISASISHDITDGYIFILDEVKTVQFTVTDSDGNEVSTSSTISIQSPNSTTATGKLNDTGITWGGNYSSGNNVDCSGETISQQDCSHGRDGTHNDNSDGHAGFSFTKLDANGNPLAASATEWSCVQDHVTGLIWEVKTDAAGGVKDLRDTTWTYMNTTNIIGYDPLNGRNGIADDTCLAPSTDSDETYCHTERYKKEVNEQGLCGASDWRLPTINELSGLVNFSEENHAIDTNYFPNEKGNEVWSSSPYVDKKYAWSVSFNGGNSSKGYPRTSKKSVRLVRVEQ